MKYERQLVFASVFFALVGCAKDQPAPAEPAPEPAPVAVAVAEPAPVAEDPSDVHIEGDHLVIDKKIHFETNSDKILDDSTEILDHIAQALANQAQDQA